VNLLIIREYHGTIITTQNKIKKLHHRISIYSTLLYSIYSYILSVYVLYVSCVYREYNILLYSLSALCVLLITAERERENEYKK